MFAARNILTPLGALIAIVAICATAPPARADLFLTITDQKSPNGTTTIDVTKNASGTATVDSYSFAYSVSSAATKTSESVSLTATVSPASSSSTPKANFELTLFSSTATSVSDIAASPKSGLFSPLGTTGSNLTLTNTSSIGSVTAKSASLSSQAGYTAYNGNTAGGIQTKMTSKATLSGGAGSTGSQSSVLDFNQKKNTSSYDISGMAVVVKQGAGGGSFTFTNTAKIALLPEPSGVAAALAGLPCLGLLVGVVRRRRLQANPVSAA